MDLHLASDVNVHVRIRDLMPEDEAEVLALFDAAEEWFIAATGQPAAPGDVQSLYYTLPEGAQFDDKVLLVITASNRIVGVVDAVLHHPAAEDCAVGLFLIHPAWQHTGLGLLTANALFSDLAARGFSGVTASLTEGWEPGRAFLERLGFAFDPPRTPDAMNRNLGPAERSVIPARLELGRVN